MGDSTPAWPEIALVWHEIALSFQKSDGTPYGALTGSAAMSAVGVGSDLEQDGSNPLDLSTQRRWAPFMSAIGQLSITVAGIPADAFCIATVSIGGA